jgi:hypothetical protein
MVLNDNFDVKMQTYGMNLNMLRSRVEKSRSRDQ